MGRGYFLVVSLILLALTLVGFGDNLFTDVGQPSNSDPKFIVHGLFCLGWMIILCVQAALVRSRNMATHRRLGAAAALVAIGVTLSTIFVFWAVWRDWALMGPEVRANRILLPSYSLFVLLGYRNRRRPDFHKRLMLVASFYMLGPVLSRSYDPLLVPFMGGLSEEVVDTLFVPIFMLSWTGFFLSLIVHDRRRIGRVHPVTGWGFLWFGAVWAIVLIG